MNGLEHIAEVFAGHRTHKYGTHKYGTHSCGTHESETQGRAALMPYFTLGYPTVAGSLDIIEALAGAGADLLELGIPFSDPLADGPTIQHSTQIALEQGVTVQGCLEMVAELRRRGVRQPLLLMGYINPILSFGIERFATEARVAGADGMIVPDLPMEEAGAVEAACRENGLALVYLVSPASPPERVAALAARASGFLYLVSLTGVTGAREALADGLAGFVGRVREVARTPLAVGFGISTPAQARVVAQVADGVIIGSALIQAAGNSADPAQAAVAFLRTVRQALEGDDHSPAKDSPAAGASSPR